MDIQGLYSLFKECSSVTTDSRNISGGELFVALKGENFNGNEFALKALEAGAKYAVVDAASTAAVSGDERVIPVPDTLQTLKDLARYHRENTFVAGKRLTVIGLTGTNGKTTTKELITRVLSSKYNVTATRGNLHNDIGVPLSLLSINGDTELAVIEMGANHPDDISKLVNVCEPDYGLITNVGRAHLLGFGSFEGVKKAKGQLYDYLAAHGGQAFVNADDPDLMAMAAARVAAGNEAYKDTVFLGFDGIQSACRSILAGELTMSVCQEGYSMGYNAVDAVVRALEGEKLEPFIDAGASIVDPTTAQARLDQLQGYLK